MSRSINQGWITASAASRVSVGTGYARSMWSMWTLAIFASDGTSPADLSAASTRSSRFTASSGRCGELAISVIHDE